VLQERLRCLQLLIHDALSFGWALWCPLAGEFWQWGIEPEGEKAVSALDHCWCAHLLEQEEEPERIVDWYPGFTFINVDTLLVMPASWPPFHVWVGATLYLLAFSALPIRHALVRLKNELISVHLHERMKYFYAQKQEELNHAVLFAGKQKCNRCQFQSVCRFLQEM